MLISSPARITSKKIPSSDDLDFFGAMYQVQQAGTQEDAGQDFADHGGLAESFQHLAQ